jgi:hypothetical protein
MKRILLILVAACCGLQTYAQNEVGRWTIIPKVGLNWAKTTDPEIYMAGTGGNDGKVKVETRTGLALGVEAEYQWKGQVSLSAGLVYSQQGSRWADAENVWKNYETKVDYLNVPITANFYVAKGLALKTGVQFGFLTNAKYEDNKNKDKFNKFNFSIPVGISYEYADFVLDARYNIAATRISKDNDEVKYRSDLIQITLGYKFAL